MRKEENKDDENDENKDEENEEDERKVRKSAYEEKRRIIRLEL